MPDDKPRTGANFKLGSLEMELPRGSRRFLVLVACLVALMYGWKEYGAQAYREFVNPDAIPIDRVQHRQMSESLVHFDETPVVEQEFHDGAVEVRHYESDDCWVIIWHLRDAAGNPILDERGNPRYVVQWVLHYSRLFNVTSSDEPLAAGMSYAPAGYRCDGRCYAPGTHPGYPSESYEPLDEYGCAWRVWWTYPDHCTYAQEANSCTNQQGPVVPVCCTH